MDFFYRLGEIAKAEDATVCLEANPAVYGTNFLTTTDEAASFVRKLNHSNIKLQLDLGTVYTNNETAETIDSVSDVVGHIHLSEPSLVPLAIMIIITEKLVKNLYLAFQDLCFKLVFSL